MIATPGEIPVNIPVAAPTTATAVLELDHVPPDIASPSVVGSLTHAMVGPVIGDVVEFTVNVIVV